MFKSKKLLAIVLSAVMVFSLNITAFADDGTLPKAADGPIEGSGEGLTVEDVNLKLTLPTVPDDDDVAGPYDFVIDPKGLTNLKTGTPQTLEALAAKGAGKIIFNQGKPITIVNESSVPITGTVKLQLADGDGSGTFSDSDVVTDPADLDDATPTNKLFFSVTASSVEVKDPLTTAAFKGTQWKALEVATAVAPTFQFKGADYNVSVDQDGVYSTAPIPKTGSGTQLLFSGLCEKDADLDDFMSSLSAAPGKWTYAGAKAQISAIVTAAGSAATDIKFGTVTITVAQNADLDDIVGLINASADPVLALYDWAIDGDDLVATASDQTTDVTAKDPGALASTTDLSGLGVIAKTATAASATGTVTPAAKVIKLQVTYDFDKVVGGEAGLETEDPLAFGMVDLTPEDTTDGNWQSPPPPSEGPWNPPTTGKVGTAIVVPFIFGSETVTAVTMGSAAITDDTSKGSHYVVNSDNITLKIGSAGSKAVKVTLSNGAAYTFTIVVS